MKRLLFLALVALPLAAHDFWIEPGTASLRVGEDFEGEPVRGSAPVLVVKKSGAVMLTYQSGAWATHEIPRATFEQFLREEGLAPVPANDVVHERFTRFAKSVVRGDASAIGALGWRFEIVPLSSSRYQVVYEGTPLANAQVVAINRAKDHVTARTDASGVVTFDLGEGAWMIKAVHLVPAPRDSGMEWESLWASLTLVR